MTLDVVVAYYNSLAFSEILPAFPNRRNNPDGSKETTNILVYDKSENSEKIQEINTKYPNIKIIQRENRGREGETYLSHIIDNYDSLAPYTIFIQDDTDNHITNIDGFFHITRSVMQEKHPFVAYPCSWKKGGNPYRRTIVDGISDLHTFPTPDAVLRATHTFGLKLPHVYQTDICAFFIVSRDRIRARPVTFYHDLREWLLSDEANGFVLEHIWQLIFTEV
jgi:hypothetical protein